MTNPGNLTDEQMQVLAQRIAAMADTSTDAPAKGVRQYVGARYVPVFANPLEWSDTREYEPLTIVTHQGNSYTSMQAVPTGIDINNSAYWAITGNYNAQIEAYRAEVQTFNSRIENNEKAIANSAIISLEELGGQKNNPAFDNAPVIESWIAGGNADKILYLPDGKWYIHHTLNLSQVEVWCDGVFACGENFQATPYIATNDTVHPAIEIGFGIEGSYTFDENYDTFIACKNWKLKIDCSLQNLTGIVAHRIWRCNIEAKIDNALEYGIFTGKYVTESNFDAGIYIMGQHNTPVVGKTAFVSRSSDYTINNLITMHYMCGIEFQAPNVTAHYWHGYGYYDAAKEGVGIRTKTEGNIAVNNVFNDGCQYCFDFFNANWSSIAVDNYNEIGRTETNQLYLVLNFDATRNWLVIQNFEMERQAEENTIKNFVVNYLVKNITTHHNGPQLSHMYLGNCKIMRRILFTNTADPYWAAFDAWKLPITKEPLISVMGNNNSFSKAELNAHHIYGIDNTAIYQNTIGRFTLKASPNWTSNSTSDVGILLEIFGQNQELTNNVTSQGGEGSTSVNIVIENIPSTYATVNI